MNSLTACFRRAGLLLLWGLATAGLARAKALSDIVSLDKRRGVVDEAVRLAHPAALVPLTGVLADPFAPPGFDLPDPDEHPLPPKTIATPGAPAAPPTDRQTLMAIAAKISPSGTIMSGGSPMLMFGKKFVRIGAHFTVSYKGSDYVLELIAIDGTTFTLRLNHEEVTRPIQPGK